MSTASSKQSSPWAKSFILVALAGASIGLVMLTRPAPKTLAVLAEQNLPLTPLLTDPTKATSLEVVSFDTRAARPIGFKVELQAGTWLVASAFNYPIDASTKMSESVSAFVGILKERVITDNPSEHARLGLIAPDNQSFVPPANASNLGGNDGRGTRVTIRSATDTLADLIIGNAQADDSQPGAPAKRYVRLANSNRVYLTTLPTIFSTRLADWVQTDLLSLPSDQITSVLIDRYSIDERTGLISNQSRINLDRLAPNVISPNPESTPPTFSLTSRTGDGPMLPLSTNERLDQEKVNAMLAAISSLRISGVRPKPASLAQALANAQQKGAMTLSDQASLQAHGFFLSPPPNSQLYANEGSMVIRAQDGLVYQLWLGEIAADDRTAQQDRSVTEPKSTPGASGRYVMITVSLDESKLESEPTKLPRLTELEELAAVPGAKLTEEQTAELEAMRSADKTVREQWLARTKATRDKANKLATKFASWYYVIDSLSLAAPSSLRPTREQLVTQSGPTPTTTPIPTPTPLPTSQPAVP